MSRTRTLTAAIGAMVAIGERSCSLRDQPSAEDIVRAAGPKRRWPAASRRYLPYPGHRQRRRLQPMTAAGAQAAGRRGTAVRQRGRRARAARYSATTSARWLHGPLRPDRRRSEPGRVVAARRPHSPCGGERGTRTEAGGTVNTIEDRLRDVPRRRGHGAARADPRPARPAGQPGRPARRIRRRAQASGGTAGGRGRGGRHRITATAACRSSRSASQSAAPRR